jgi:hypothetical protein
MTKNFENFYVYVGLSENTKIVYWNWIDLLRRLGIVNFAMTGSQLGNDRFRMVFEYIPYNQVDTSAASQFLRDQALKAFLRTL